MRSAFPFALPSRPIDLTVFFPLLLTLPSFTVTWNKAGKRDKEEQRILARHNAEKAEREETRRDQFESRQRIDSTYRGMDRDAENAAGAKMRAKARGAERGRYQFEATASDDEVEDEIDSNLDEMSSVVGRLKALATTAGCVSSSAPAQATAHLPWPLPQTGS